MTPPRLAAKLARSRKEKKAYRVMLAVQSGCRTAREVEAFTGISVKICGAWLSLLHKMGSIELMGYTHFGERRARANVWRMAKESALQTRRDN